MSLLVDVEVELARGRVLRGRGTVESHCPVVGGIDDDGTLRERADRVRLTLPEGAVVHGTGIVPLPIIEPGVYVVTEDGELSMVIDAADTDQG